MDLSKLSTAVLTQLLEIAVVTKDKHAVELITAELSKRY